MTIAEMIRESNRLTPGTLGYIAHTDGPSKTPDREILKTTLIICNCPSYSTSHRH